MEFYEFDSFNDEIPLPQPSLSIPIPGNIELLSKKLPLNFKTLLNLDGTPKNTSDSLLASQSVVAEKYAKASLKFLDSGDKMDVNVTGVTPQSTLSNKLSKVLNNSTNDAIIKEVFNLDVEEDQIIDSGLMGSLSRKKLRSKVEAKLIKNQTMILREYYPVIKQFKEVEKKLNHLNQLSTMSNDKLTGVVEHVELFNKEFKLLNQDKSMIKLKKNLLINFKNKFILNEFEEFTITNNEITPDFFATMEKLDKINENSSILLSIDNSNLGINIMKKINKLVDKSNDTLSNSIKRSLIHPVWVNSKLKVHTFHLSIKTLLTRNKDLLDRVFQEFISDRSKQLIEDFEKQINSLNAHDPTRYIGDLLAYVHAMVINELELMNSIFKVSLEELEGDLDQSDVERFDAIIDDLLDKILSRLSKLIKTKFEQLISIELKLKIIYSIFNLFDLYKLMFEKNFHESNSLLKTVKSLIEFTQNRMVDLIESRLKSIKSSNSAQLDLSSDLQPPEWISEFYSVVLPLIEQSQEISGTVFNLNETELNKFLTLIVNEPINILNQHLSAKDFTEIDRIILKLNFLDLILSKILPLSLFNDKTIEIHDLVEKLKGQLVELQYKDILVQLKMNDFQNIINMILPFDESFFEESLYEPIVENKMFVAENIDKINTALEEHLPNTLIELQNSMMKLNNPMMLNFIVEECVGKFCKFYSMFGKLTDYYLHKKLIWPATEVATLLGVETK